MTIDGATRVGVDTGGTFCDLVAVDGSVVKVPSTADDPSRAVAAALGSLGSPGSRVSELAHGTTVATNALLERRGARVALVTNAGFADVIEIARQARPSLYDSSIVRPEPLVPRERRFEIEGRVGADGRESRPVRLDGLNDLADRLLAVADAVAVCLLHSDLDPSHERAVGAALRARGIDVTCSHEISPEYREYERFTTTVVNAFLRPVCRTYLDQLAGLAPRVAVMTSDAGLVDLGTAAAAPASLLLSGPAGGVLAASAVAVGCGYPDVVTFDMGGTSTDIGVVRGGRPEPAAERSVAGFPIRLPSLDIHTIGAGGGSIAGLDAGGALFVGPRSAGAQPGPAAYGHGGTEPTVTDADLVLGRIPSDRAFSGLGRLDLTAATAALARREVEADGVAMVVDSAMADAVRVMTVERGIDPRGLALVAFGGAGPLHACAVAEALDISTVIVPPRAGVLSAVGLLCAPRAREFVRSVGRRSVESVIDDALHAARAGVADEHATITFGFDCRYEGQSHELTVASPLAFNDEHRRRNGFVLDREVEVVTVRAHASVASPVDVADLPPVTREPRRGPAVVIEGDSTMYLPKGWSARVGPLSAWIVERA